MGSAVDVADSSELSAASDIHGGAHSCQLSALCLERSSGTAAATTLRRDGHVEREVAAGCGDQAGEAAAGMPVEQVVAHDERGPASVLLVT